MNFLLLLTALSVDTDNKKVAHPYSPWTASNSSWSSGSNEFNCAMRKVAYEYGLSLPAGKRHGKFEDLFNALGLNVECKDEFPEGGPDFKQAKSTVEKVSLEGGNVVYVCYENGDDSNNGTISAPFKTIQVGVAAVGKIGEAGTVFLRGGTHYLQETVQFSAENSGITIENYNNERVVVSGAQRLDPKWEPFNCSSSGCHCPRAYRSEVRLREVPGLHLNGVRVIRARYPNGNPELPEKLGAGGNPNGPVLASYEKTVFTPPDFSLAEQIIQVKNDKPQFTRNDSYMFKNYVSGIGGPCSIYDPPVSFWCSDSVDGGASAVFAIPRGLTTTSSSYRDMALPYSSNITSKTNPAIFYVYHPRRWAMWMFEVSEYNKERSNFTFGKGGFQGSRGSGKFVPEGGDWAIENVFEELDAPNEFFYDDASEFLYLCPNQTGTQSPGGAPTSDDVFEVPLLRTLFNLTAESRWNPISDVTIRGLTFTGTRYTFMDPHAVPSAGDWALERSGAVALQGTERVQVLDCNFTRIDGNALLISGYNRNTTVDGSDFSYLGGSAIVNWGFTNETAKDPLEGMDGTDGNHPLYTKVTGSVFRELGIYQKQSAAFFQAKAALSTFSENIVFNLPRAGVNLNDGFGGGDVLQKNLIFSTVKETTDHGPFNSWDRQPFVTTYATGFPSVSMIPRTLSHNFLINNYDMDFCVDNDDGSRYYRVHDNVLMAGERGIKTNFGGHDIWHYNNLYLYIRDDWLFQKAGQFAGHNNHVFDNTALFKSTDLGLTTNCTGAGKIILENNTLYNEEGKVGWTCLNGGDINGYDFNTIAKYPSDDYVVGLAKKKLGLS